MVDHGVVSAPGTEPVLNPRLARVITWTVAGAQRSPRRLVNEQLWGRYGTTETQLTELPEGWSLNVVATVGGRARDEMFRVDRNAYDKAMTAGTFETRGSFYAVRFVLLVALWAATAVCAWAYLFQPPVLLSLASIAVLLVSPSFVSKAVVRGMWWAGRGLLNEARGRWILAGALWAFALAPLIELQVIVG